MTYSSASVFAPEVMQRPSFETSAFAHGHNNLDIDAQKKGQLEELIWKFSQIGFPQLDGCFRKISPLTRQAAITFICLIPIGRVLPQIVPDEDGALLLAWQVGGSTLLVYIDEWRIHLVSNAGAPDATYIENASFTGRKIPAKILSFIPETNKYV